MAVLLPAIGVHAQVVERERPSEWSQLVEGARFMDRFLPMPKGETIEGIWGIDALQRRYVDNGIESPETSFWVEIFCGLLMVNITCMSVVGQRILPKDICSGETRQCFMPSVIIL